MREMALCAAALAVGLLFASCDAYADIVPSPAIQQRLREILVGQSEDEWQENLAQIESLALKLKVDSFNDRVQFLEQLIYFDSNISGEHTGEETPFAIGKLVKESAFTGKELLGASTPHWIGADENLKKTIHEWVQVATSLDSDPTDKNLPNLVTLQDAEGGLPEGLVAYLYDRDPARAVLTLARLYSATETEIQELKRATSSLPRPRFGKYSDQKAVESRETGRELVSAMSRNDKWWVRLYALSIGGVVTEIAPTGLLDRMKEDRHPYISHSASRALLLAVKTGDDYRP